MFVVVNVLETNTRRGQNVQLGPGNIRKQSVTKLEKNLQRYMQPWRCRLCRFRIRGEATASVIPIDIWTTGATPAMGDYTIAVAVSDPFVCAFCHVTRRERQSMLVVVEKGVKDER